MIYYKMAIKKIDRVLTVFLSLITVLVAFIYLLRVIGDPDFFWHLKTGQWIWEHRALPSEDPFAYTSLGTIDFRGHFILTAYWLSQIIYHLIYDAHGFVGIIVLRFVITAALVYFLFRRQHGDNNLYLGLLIIFLIMLLGAYNNNDRPQAFSFLFFSALLYLLERSRLLSAEEPAGMQNGGIRSALVLGRIVPVPLLMLVWGNMHGGHILGQAVIVLYIISDGLKFIHPSLKPVGNRAYLNLCAAGCSGLAFSLANPNPDVYHSILELFTLHSSWAESNLEYQSTLVMFTEFGDTSMLLYWFVLALTAAALIMNFRSLDITDLALIAGTAYFSFTGMRYIPFFMIAALPVAGRLLSKRALVWARVIVLLASFWAIAFFALKERGNIHNIPAHRWTNSYSAPENIASFILRNDLKGNMYNHYQYGGYFIWRLAPERKVFIDGRALNKDVYDRAQAVNNAAVDSRTGFPLWKEILEYYGVRYIALPLFDPSGQVLPIVNALVSDTAWVPVYYDYYSVIFVKDSPENAHVLSGYAIPRALLAANLPR